MEKKLADLKYFLWILVLVGFIWLRAGVEKLMEGTFVDHMAQTLGAFAAKNPYPWYKGFLESAAIPNAQVFGLMTMWGELLVGLGLLGAVGYVLWKKRIPKLTLAVLAISLLSGLLMNVNYWFASGYLNPAGDGLNLLMAGVEVIGLVWCYQLYKSATK